MYASCISCLAEVEAEKCRWTWDSRCFEAGEEFRREDMALWAVRRDIMKQEMKWQKGENRWEEVVFNNLGEGRSGKRSA
jgi:hypothetical protein